MTLNTILLQGDKLYLKAMNNHLIHLPPGVIYLFVSDLPKLVIVSCFENELNFDICCQTEQNIDLPVGVDSIELPVVVSDPEQSIVTSNTELPIVVSHAEPPIMVGNTESPIVVSDMILNHLLWWVILNRLLWWVILNRPFWVILNHPLWWVTPIVVGNTIRFVLE